MQRVMSRNGYSYVEGNPVNYTDPSGEIALVDDLAFLLIGGAVLLTIAVVSYILLANVPDTAGLERALEDVKNLCLGTTAASLIVQALSHSTAPDVPVPTSAVQVASASAGAITVPVPGVPNGVNVPDVCQNGECTAFVEKLLEALLAADVAANTRVTMWVDGGEFPPISSYTDPESIRTTAQVMEMNPLFQLSYDGYDISSPKPRPRENGVLDWFAAYHAYISFNYRGIDLVFDNKNTTVGVPRLLYQSALQGVAWRNCYEFGLNPVEIGLASKKLDDLVYQARYREDRIPSENKLGQTNPTCRGI